jgi:hypothetical protein
MKQIWMVLVVLFYQCSSDRTEDGYSPIEDVPDAMLIFQAEQQVEVWMNGQVHTVSTIDLATLPIGVYRWQTNRLMNEKDTIGLKSILTNQEWLTYSGNAFIFPNDARTDGQFHPCFRCPHSTAALYSRLWLHLQDYDQVVDKD